MKYCVAVDLTKELTPSKEVRYEARSAQKEGLEVKEAPFREFREFYASIVEVKKSDDEWERLSKIFFAFIAYKDGVPISAAAFSAAGSQVYYGMAVTDFNSPYSKHASYLLHLEVMKILKERGYEWYVLGTEDVYKDVEKSKRIWDFKKHFGDVYEVEGSFPFSSFKPTDSKEL